MEVKIIKNSKDTLPRYVTNENQYFLQLFQMVQNGKKYTTIM